MNIELLLLAYAGIVAHYLTRFKEIVDSNRPFKLNPLSEILGGLLTVLTTTILVYVKDDIATIYVVTPVGAALLGYAGQSVFNKLVGSRFPQKIADAESVIGGRPDDRNNPKP